MEPVKRGPGRPRKVVVTATERSLIEPNPERDAFFMPGYSDKRQEREWAQRRGERGPSLNGRLHLVVTQDLQGKPTKLKERAARMRGGVPLTKEMADKLGYNVDASGYEVRPDGTVGLNEYTVFYASPDAAEKHRGRIAEKNAAMEETARGRVEEATSALNSALGLQGRGATSPLFEEQHNE
jgi:hypothetical protein